MNCPVLTQNGASRRMAMAAEAFGNKMCFLEDITLEVKKKHQLWSILVFVIPGPKFIKVP